MKEQDMTKKGQVWTLPSGATIQLTQHASEKGLASKEPTGDWLALYRGGSDETNLLVSSRFLAAHGDLVGDKE